ncbi:SMI1/KNR4 family protein [Marinobacter daepoensis]|uniref:SMI1/KNR4 family protein n=1 Tax=Marinobacter daepoensis TaxID=262077 RepID=UPI001C959C11|nr:SMI1/KNR4 family protein [Marinobacter daepoensis]MBY6031555.1 SMI1/KNR4 family protein [Marinobacter daepoensis]
MAIAEIEAYFGKELPKAYRDFVLGQPTGITGDIHLYPPALLVERNECYETRKYAPGYLNIGDDGGGQAFLIRLDEDDPAVVAVGHGSMDPKFKELVCSSFSGWVATGFQYEDG